MKEIYFQGKKVIITNHAARQAEEREIGYPDHVLTTIQTGKVERFGKHMLRFTNRTKEGSIVCVGQDVGYVIIIKTVERGN